MKRKSGKHPQKLYMDEHRSLPIRNDNVQAPIHIRMSAFFAWVSYTQLSTSFVF